MNNIGLAKPANSGNRQQLRAAINGMRLWKPYWHWTSPSKEQRHWGAAHEIDSIEVGKLADLVIIEENPLQNLKVLYGTGAIKLTDDNEVVRVGGVKYTIKDGIVYDAKKLLADVKQMVQEAKEKDGYEIYQPGLR